ncbi:MAG TPA: hypothetical protein VLF18_08615 [Tahibacter sp.]|uniref:hypothetical protein n=1 Tax=Tahibacter sp. TaxID=2056211 RepID=UPI002B73ECC5|nr:hypothetical protein [Tahibacter sp.]HSX60246.1 hypothetical protein [Tahibacter sp.]
MRLVAIIAFQMYAVAASAQQPDDALASSVDRMVAKSLTDPLSAIDYRVSRPLECKLALVELDFQSGDCVCYSVNAKNGFGGYTGSKTFAAQFEHVGRDLRLMPPIQISDLRAIAACEAANLSPRPAENISRRVSR